MSERKWTQGPWAWKHDNLWEMIADDIRGDLVMKTSGVENEYDLDLIAAAPDLYEALDLAMYYLAGNGYLDDDGPMPSIISALAKARGE
jgi:hypothetical protein